MIYAKKKIIILSNELSKTERFHRQGKSLIQTGEPDPLNQKLSHP